MALKGACGHCVYVFICECMHMCMRVRFLRSCVCGFQRSMLGVLNDSSLCLFFYSETNFYYVDQAVLELTM